MPNPDIIAPPAPPTVSLTPAWQTLAATGARWVLTLAAGWLVKKGITDSGTSAALVDAGAGVAVGALALGWSMLEKWLAQKKFATALALPAGSTPADVAQAIKVA